MVICIIYRNISKGIIIRMKKFKFFIILLVVSLSLLSFYKEYMYYKISYNPLTKISECMPEKCYFNEYNSYSGQEVKKTSENSNTNVLIFEYLRNLKLKPLKQNNKETYKHETNTYFSYGFKFDSSSNYYIFINEIYLDNLTVMRISSNKPGFPNGYYKISDSKFNYTYVNNLIINSGN